jgi:hypothetical protein
VHLTGSCACGEISYRISQPLRNARSCHCSRCRKTFSAQASAYAEVAPASFEWISGESSLRSYATQEDFGLQFCGQCGSTLVGTHKGLVHGVTLGCVDGDPGVEIEMHIFVGSKAAWEVLPQNVPCFQGAPD